MTKSNRWLFVSAAGIAGLGVLAIMAWFALNQPPSTDFLEQAERIQAVEINGTIVHVELALSSQAQQAGLSNRALLADGQGLLFLYPSLGRRIFWMKDMNFPIDIIWIKGDRIISLTENAAVPVLDQPLTTYSPAEAVDAVLEVSAGFVHSRMIRTGMAVQFQCLSDQGIDGRLVPC